MPKLYIGDERIRKVYIGEDRIKKIYIGNDLVFSDSHLVTYHINTNDVRQVEVDDGENALDSQWAPTATLSGFTFVGWRQDTQANPSVLPSKTVTEDNIHLYAVFSRTLTLTYNGNGATSGSTASQTGTQYYNNGNLGNPTLIVNPNGYGRRDYNFIGWGLNQAGVVQYQAGTAVTITNNSVMYAIWQLSYNPYPSQWVIGTISNLMASVYVTWGGPRWVTNVSTHSKKWGFSASGYEGTNYIYDDRTKCHAWVYGVTNLANPQAGAVLLAVQEVDVTRAFSDTLVMTSPVNGSYSGILVKWDAYQRSIQPSSQGSWNAWGNESGTAGTYGGLTFTF